MGRIWSRVRLAKWQVQASGITSGLVRKVVARGTVRDREAPGSNPGPPTNFEFKIADFGRHRKTVGRREVTAVSQILLEHGGSSGLRTVD